jgi:ABC-type glycerol-3-phosphate transport system permease component
VLLAFAAIAIVPVYFMVVSSFKTRDDYIGNSFGLPSEWTLATMRAALRGNDLLLWLLNSTIVTVGAVGISTLIAAAAAYPLALKGWRPSGAIISLLVVLMALPPIVLVVPLFQLVVDTGQQNTYTAAVVIYTGLLLPFSTFLLVGFFRTIPRSLLEAARVDGAGELRTLVAIVMPLSRPALITVVIVQALWVWNEVLIAIIFLQADNLRTLMVGVTVYQSRYRADVPLTMAGMLWATVPMLALYLAGQRFFIRGLTAGGVKG